MDIRLKINGVKYCVSSKDFSITGSLNTFIRQHAQLTGTKVMCHEGGCGACVVTVLKTDPVTKKRKLIAINSCLKPLYASDGLEVTTIEGLGNKKKGYHVLQRRFDECNATQCGYCTPGMIMNLYGILGKGKSVDMATIEKSFSGNLCRCTGYRPILDCAKSLACDASADLLESCKDKDLEEMDIEDLTLDYCPKRGVPCTGTCGDESDDNHHPRMAITVKDNRVWIRVTTMKELLETLCRVTNDKYMLVAGNTAQGITRISKSINTFIDISPIDEMRRVVQGKDTLTIGSLATLAETHYALKAAEKLNGFDYCGTLAKHLELVANVPVRNAGTIGGNLAYKQKHRAFQSDVFVCFDTVDARVTLIDSLNVKTTVTMNAFLNTSMYKKCVYNIILPRLEPKALVRTFKNMIRTQNADAYVNAGFHFKLINNRITYARICYGGINPAFSQATKTACLLVGRELHTNETLQLALASLRTEIQADSVLPAARPEYRNQLAASLFYRFVLNTCPVGKLSCLNKSGASPIERPLSSGTQSYDTFVNDFPLSKPVKKYEGMIQTSGEALYTNDMPPMKGELYGAFAVAKQPNAIVAQIDASDALSCEGVRHFLSAKNIPGVNNCINNDMFAPEPDVIFLPINAKCQYNCQPVGIVLADSWEQAILGARKVAITYYKTDAITDIGFSIFSKARSMLDPLIGTAETPIYPTIHDVPEHQLHKLVDTSNEYKKLATTSGVNITKTIKGTFDTKGQYHFYMEPQTAIACPDEMGMIVYSSTQFADNVQHAVAAAINRKVNYVQMRLRRIGGGFGGKIYAANRIACAAALGCDYTQRPVRVILNMEDNMDIIGKRHAMRSRYEVQTDDKGKIQKLSNTFVEDNGCSANEAPHLMTGPAFRNGYMDASWTVNGSSALTTSPSNTFCRGPGTMEGIAMIENIMEDIAFVTGNDAKSVRLENMPKDSPLVSMYKDFHNKIEFDKLQAACVEFNRKNRWQKQGIATIPMRWPVMYIGSMPVFVAIYHGDGSVAVSHGGVECGQGINTKVCQVIAYMLGVPMELVSIRPMDTMSSANAGLTGGSITSEMVCHATKKTCDILLQRMKPIRDAMPAGYTWPQLVRKCSDARMDLRATAQVNDVDLTPYMVYGCAFAHVLLDVLSGNHCVLRVDILEDVGESISPKVDVGQVEGAFVMGQGFWTCEELIYNKQNGKLLTNRTWNYKPPGAQDIPAVFNVTFVKKSPNPLPGVLRAKAVGEPALCMSIVVMFALRNAIHAARKQAGLPSTFVNLGSSCTPEKIFMKCGNKIGNYTL